ncbi:UDP-N-acetylmuramoyl-L-alanyl-D-glutamate--2,6-diaminopimelate ligase [Raineyella fluvialis]|uniref:UDP-N-acetylmuramoyl-L-alanyl-D-glutamate--2,6-diaminopimelate ligase n=1 Tax=Raineyella fluvialis TaxID=2662261 RepID=A0A5Q2FDK5_9ACTN|nr:UDP-N-acetylmuramoyl-L-alanyl-D-glutamate--2,6-diaminopimelate ligase [Raineyella fluvialis]
MGHPADLQGADPEVVIAGLTLDSRLVLPGDAYVALAGTRTHGIRFAASALGLGAAVVLTDRAGADDPAAEGLPVIAVDRPRTLMAHWAAEVYGRPAENLTMYGITGTNGKTTTAVLLAAGLTAAGRKAGTIGTLGFRVGDLSLDASRTTITTPESVDLHALLAVMREAGAESVAMEVSSHAMVFERVEAVPFAVAGFTNLGRDHLDFHPTLEDYFQAKAGLFHPEHTRTAVISIDDQWGVRLAEESRGRLEKVWTTSFADPSADWYAHDVVPLPSGGSRVAVTTPTGPLEIEVGLPGLFNARNAVTCAAMLAMTGVDVRAALPGLATAQVPGRMQIVDLGAGAPLAVVDFAHTPQAVASALEAFAARPTGKLIAVLGCGGDRDQEKRGPMGAAAATWADVVVVTDDNPRSEDPRLIRDAVLAGATEAVRTGAVESVRPGHAGAVEVLDGGERADAITTALRLAGPDDVVAVLGKGHEQGQIVGERVIPFDDVEAIRTAWRTLED